jgi:hypothetical protein
MTDLIEDTGDIPLDLTDEPDAVDDSDDAPDEPTLERPA